MLGCFGFLAYCQIIRQMQYEAPEHRDAAIGMAKMLFRPVNNRAHAFNNGSILVTYTVNPGKIGFALTFEIKFVTVGFILQAMIGLA